MPHEAATEEFAAWLERKGANRDYRDCYYGPEVLRGATVDMKAETSRWHYKNSAFRAWGRLHKGD